MSNVSLEIVIILLLLVANGYLALSEIALVSARRSRLEQRAARGDPAAHAAVILSRSPARFLSTVQVGITLIGVLSGAYGGATIATELTGLLSRFPQIAPYSKGASIAIVVFVISYLSVIIGELVPKRVALSDPEWFAAWVARPMTLLSRVAGPVVTGLERTSNLVLKVFRFPQAAEPSITEADVSAMIAAGTAAGVFEPAERRIVERAFRLDDEPVAAMMTTRRDIVWLDVNDSEERHYDLIRQHPYSRFPLCDGSLDRILGVVNVRDVSLAQRETPAPAAIDLRSIARPPLFVPDTTVALDVLQRFQSTGTHIAIVIDEHGSVEGLLTLNNVLMFLVAAPSESRERHEEAAMVRRSADSWLVDGALSLGDFYAGVGLDDPGAEPKGYHTVAGLVMAHFGRIPTAGDRVAVGPLVFEVADMDGLRIDKVLVVRTAAPGPTLNE